MRLLVALTCIVAVKAIAIPISGILESSLGLREYGYDGQRGGGFGQSGYDRESSDRGREYSRDRQDFKAIVETHNSRELDRSHDRSYQDRGYQSGGYGNSGHSGYGRGY